MNYPFPVIGLTGGIATGKSTVAALLQEKGAVIIDADVLAREATLPTETGYRQIVEHWGAGILNPDGSIDRSALARLVFSQPPERARLEAIIHPRVKELTALRLRQLSDLPPADRPPLVIEVIPLLFEAGLEGEFDEVWVVACPQTLQEARLAERDRLDEAAVKARLASQWPLALKVDRADRVIENTGGVDELAREVDVAWQAAMNRFVYG